MRPTTLIGALAVLTAAMLPRAAAAQQAPIVAHILESDTAVVIAMPQALMARLMPGTPAPAEPADIAPGRRSGVAGWRVQVFSDNNPRTSKAEARAKEMSVASRFPQYRTYKKYTAPYWRVHVGDFRTAAEAEAAAAEMRKAFPAFGKEIRVVRDRINPAD